jgi:hypothetical protein
VEVPVLISDQLRLACEEAALSNGLNVPMIKIISYKDIQISSDGICLYLSSEIAQMPSAPRLALIAFALYFHTEIVARQRKDPPAPPRIGQRLAALMVGLRSAPRKLEKNVGEDASHSAREAAKASYKGSHAALLQAVLIGRMGLQSSHDGFVGARLFEDGEEIGHFAQHLDGLIEGDFSDDQDHFLPLPNKLLKLAHKTSKLLDAGERNVSSQVASLNRLYQSIGPVGSVAYMICRISSGAPSDAERVQIMLELLTKVQPLQVRLQLVDFAASQLLGLSDARKLSLMSLLREALSSSVEIGEAPILTWTLLSVLRSKLHITEPEDSKPKPLSDKAKRRCIGELFFVAAELGGEESSISARALRNQVDAVCESLDIDRPVSSPDEFQAAAWLEALDDLDRFSLHETLSILDALCLWGQEDRVYQTWLDAVCQRLKVQRQLATGTKSKSGTKDTPEFLQRSRSPAVSPPAT